MSKLKQAHDYHAKMSSKLKQAHSYQIQMCNFVYTWCVIRHTKIRDPLCIRDWGDMLACIRGELLYCKYMHILFEYGPPTIKTGKLFFYFNTDDAKRLPLYAFQERRSYVHSSVARAMCTAAYKTRPRGVKLWFGALEAELPTGLVSPDKESVAYLLECWARQARQGLIDKIATCQVTPADAAVLSQLSNAQLDDMLDGNFCGPMPMLARPQTVAEILERFPGLAPWKWRKGNHNHLHYSANNMDYLAALMKKPPPQLPRMTCYRCAEPGHYSSSCTKKRSPGPAAGVMKEEPKIKKTQEK